MIAAEPLPAAPDLRVAPFTAEHLAGAWSLSQQASWPHREQDWALTLSVSQGLAALADDRVVGTALCSNFGAAAALSMIIVDRALRGRGLGRTLMVGAMAKAGSREMRLTATAEGLPLYASLGFVEVGRIAQHQGVARSVQAEATVRRGGAGDVARLAQMDAAASGLSRAALLQRIAADGEVLLADRGFALLRAFGRGHVVGPIVAQDDATARALLAAAATRMQGRFLRVDVPEARGLSAFAETLGLARAGGGVAMALNAAARPAADRPAADHQTYALVSQALG
jgi:predicted N-acetyltransferase YhbS